MTDPGVRRPAIDLRADAADIPPIPAREPELRLGVLEVRVLARRERFAPLEPKLEWERVKEFTRLLAEFLVKAEPDLFVANMSKVKRSGRIFVDYLRNSETASAVSAYSARARKDAGVSTPLDWDELGAKDVRDRFTVLTVPKRLAKLTLDPWAEYTSARQSITAAMWRALGSKEQT